MPLVAMSYAWLCVGEWMGADEWTASLEARIRRREGEANWYGVEAASGLSQSIG